MTRPSVAIVHDYLTQRGGAERVVLALSRAFPDAPVHTALFEPSRTFPEFCDVDVRASVLDRIPPLRRHHRGALPLLAPAFSSMRIDADVVICSSSGWAHGVRATGRKIVYCHAPARWLYQKDAYLRHRGAAARASLYALRRPLVRWDARAARSADTYIAVSRHTRAMIRDAYGIDAEVVHPPCTIERSGAQQPIDVLVGEPFHLCVSRLLPYKHVDAVAEAFRDLPDTRLVVVGAGPDDTRLRRIAPGRVTFLRSVTDAELRWLYAHARALIAASYEDFGLTPVEAARFGTPTAALHFGGYLDTVVDGCSGVFFDEPEPMAIADAVRKLDELDLDRDAIGRHAEAFGEDRFAARMADLVADGPAR